MNYACDREAMTVDYEYSNDGLDRQHRDSPEVVHALAIRFAHRPTVVACDILGERSRGRRGAPALGGH